MNEYHKMLYCIRRNCKHKIESDVFIPNRLYCSPLIVHEHENALRTSKLWKYFTRFYGKFYIWFFFLATDFKKKYLFLSETQKRLFRSRFVWELICFGFFVAKNQIWGHFVSKVLIVLKVLRNNFLIFFYSKYCVPL